MRRAGGDDGPGLGSGFVLDERGEIATNAHVVTEGEGRSIRKAREVYVAFADGNEVSARIVGFDPDSDVALLSALRRNGVGALRLPRHLPAARASLRSAGDDGRLQTREVEIGGDIVSAIDGRRLEDADALGSSSAAPPARRDGPRCGSFATGGRAACQCGSASARCRRTPSSVHRLPPAGKASPIIEGTTADASIQRNV